MRLLKLKKKRIASKDENGQTKCLKVGMVHEHRPKHELPVPPLTNTSLLGFYHNTLPKPCNHSPQDKYSTFVP